MNKNYNNKKIIFQKKIISYSKTKIVINKTKKFIK